MTAEQQDKPANSVAPPAPGATLRKAREAAGLSADDLARSLRLRLQVIQAMDADDYDKLPAPTFVHGYLRHYADAVGLSAEDLIAAYRLHSGEKLSRIVPEFSNPTQARSNDSPVKAASWFIGLIMVMLVIAWWQSPNIYSDEDTAIEAPAGEQSAAPERELLLPGTNGPMPQDTTVIVPGSVTPADAAALQALLVNEARTPGHLRLTVKSDSWIEITDADGQRMFYGMGKQGQEIELEVMPPISLLFGYAPGIEVEYNGEPFDHKPHTQAGIARFELGPVAE